MAKEPLQKADSGNHLGAPDFQSNQTPLAKIDPVAIQLIRGMSAAAAHGK